MKNHITERPAENPTSPVPLVRGMPIAFERS
jgi:hypothetical protein